MDDPQADAMGGGAERGYGEQCADTDGLAAATDAFETALQDAEQRLADGLAARAGRAFYLNADANNAYCARWIEARRREAEAASARDQQRANTDGLAAADTDGLALRDAEEQSVSSVQAYFRAAAARDRENAELRAECQRLIAVERRTYELFEAAATRQPLSAGWHHLACVTAPQPKPLPARALNARYRGGLITEVGP